MEILNVEDREAKRVTSRSYKGQPLPVKEVWIKWLSQAGLDENLPDYGLRFFTVSPGGSIPIHDHLYVQTIYILSGRLLVASHDAETDEKVEEKMMDPNDLVFFPSMEPHSMKNPSDSEETTFLCCIANVYEDEPD